MVSGGTDTHIVLMDLTKTILTGKVAEEALDEAGITVNKNEIPFDSRGPVITSGIRIGTSAVTTRGMKEREMTLIANFLAQIVNEIEPYRLPAVKEQIKDYLKKFREDMSKNEPVKRIKKEVLGLSQKFPIPGI